MVDGVRFFRNRKRGNKQYWKCSYYYKNRCPTIIVIEEDTARFKITHEHTHAKPQVIIKTAGVDKTRKTRSLRIMKQNPEFIVGIDSEAGSNDNDVDLIDCEEVEAK